MAVQILFQQQLYQFPPGMPLNVYLKELDLDAEAVLAVCKGELITEEEILQDGELVKIIPVISGGAA